MKRFLLVFALFFLVSPALATDRTLMIRTGGTDHVADDARYLNESSNLSDVDSVATSRNNLGLGTGDSVTFLDLTLTSGDAASYTVTNLLFSTATGTDLTVTTLNGAIVSAFGLSLLDDANAAAGRGTLGLGACATAGFANFTEINAGTESAKAIPPSAMGDSFYNVQPAGIGQGAETALTAIKIGCGTWPYAGTWEAFSSASVAQPEAALYTASSSGDVALVFYRIDSVGTTEGTIYTFDIDVNEIDSTTAGTAPALGAAYTLTMGDRFCLKCTSAGTGAYGATATVPFRKQ